MQDIKKIAGYNLLIMIGYVLIFALDNAFSLSVIFISIHFIITAFASFAHFVAGRYSKGKAYLLTSGILFLIGYSTCYGFNISVG